MKDVYHQLNRLDPANRSLAIHGFVDKNLKERKSCIDQLISKAKGCPSVLHVDHIHKGPKNNREMIHVSLLEFRSNGEREKAFDYLAKISAKDAKEGKLTVKRARSSLQKQRNDMLVKAHDLIKGEADPGHEVKLDWKSRKVTCQGSDAFIQYRTSNQGIFQKPFEELKL